MVSSLRRQDGFVSRLVRPADESDSELHHLVSLFERGSYAALVSSFSALPPALQAAPLARIYLARSHLALTPPALAAALAALAPLPSTLDTQALASFVQYLAAVQSKQDTAGALDELEMVLAELGEKGLEQSYDMAQGDAGEGRFVRAVVATVYILEGTDDKREEAIEILREGIELGQDQECLAILSHLYLALALPSHSKTLLESGTTTAFTSDSLLSQLLTARTSLVSGPTSKYQAAFYVYEELKSMQGGRGSAILNGVAVAQAALAHWVEADAAIKEAEELNGADPTTLANVVALSLHTGKPAAVADAAYSQLKSVAALHPMVLDLEAHSSMFDEAAAKFGVQVAA